MSLTKLRDLKQFIPVNHNRQDVVVQIMLDAAEEYIANFCGIKLISEDGDSLVDPADNLDGGMKNLWVHQHPMTEVISIVDREDGTTYTGQIFSNKNRIWRDDDTIWEPGSERWQVSYRAGYTASNLPAGLKLEIFNLGARAYQSRGGEGSSSTMGYNVNWNNLMDSDMIVRLRSFSFRRPIS